CGSIAEANERISAALILAFRACRWARAQALTGPKSNLVSNASRRSNLAVVDECTREYLVLAPDTSISGQRVARELSRLIAWCGKPRAILSDNGTELTSNAILGWADERHVAWRYIQPGKPAQNARIMQRSSSARISQGVAR